MKLNLFETHDRFLEFTKPTSNQSVNIAKCCQDLIDKRPFGPYPFYIFSHARTDDDGVTKRLIWQPRLTRPKPQTNSMLFKAYPGTDNVKICWMIPAREMWNQYQRKNVTANETVIWSINMFQFNRRELERNEPDDLNENQIDSIYRELSLDAHQKKLMDNIYGLGFKQETSEESLTSS